MSAKDLTLLDGLELRGKTFYARFRVPARYAAIESRREINQSLKTRDRREARLRLEKMRERFIFEWEGKLAVREGRTTPEGFHAITSLLEAVSFNYSAVSEIAKSPVEELLARIETVGQHGADSDVVPAVLGAHDRPKVNVADMPERMLEHHASSIARKNPNQRREWLNKYKSAAGVFVSLVSNKPVDEINEREAMTYRAYWIERMKSDGVTLNYARKKIRHLKQMIDTYYEEFAVPISERRNPFENLKIDGAAAFSNDEGTKIPLPAGWVARLVAGEVLAGLENNQEAQDIAVIAAATGSRQSEVYNVPPENIFLDHPIPHFVITFVADGENKTEIKNKASQRVVPLIGPALDAMRRHPTGFPRYRGKAGFSNFINKHLRENDLFPPPTDEQRAELVRRTQAVGKTSDEGLDRPFTFGCTRHTFEDRMRAVRLSNEERAYLMGHSVGRVRGRPVYGSGPDLRLRVLYMELVSYPTPTWQPRNRSVIRAEIEALQDKIAEAREH